MNVLDLFSGIGAFSLGLDRAGMRTVAFCEQDPFCRRVLAKHWPEVPCYDDVRTLSAQHLTEIGPIDVICGGFPCQDISVAGAGEGINGARSGLWSEYARLIGEIRPQYVIVENVAALLFRGLGRVLGDLASLGYDAEWHCIPASAIGAPHRRDRIWIIAYPTSWHPRNWDAQQSGRSSEAWRMEPAGLGCVRTHVANADGTGFERPRSSQSAGWISDPILAGQGSNVADPECDGLEGSQPTDRSQDDRGRRSSFPGSKVADASGARLSLPKRKAILGAGWRDEGGATTECGWWAVEPDVGRVAHGIANRVDRLRSLGNSLVPQIPEMIGRAIMNQKSEA